MYMLKNSLPLSLPLLLLRTHVLCLYIGESCVADDKSGSCTILSECKPLVAEIIRAGSPMPKDVTRKLQELTCGFNAKEPLVCCTFSANTETASPIPLSTTYGEEIPNRKEPTFGNDRNNNIPIFFDNNGQNAIHNNIDDGPPDIEDHPNLGLLPSAACGNIEDDKIVGGNRTSLFQMPWMVLLSYRLGWETRFSCSGTLINEWYVLTAAHCVSFLGNLHLNGVILGEHDIRQDPDCEILEGMKFCASNIKNVTIDTVIAHPGYNRQTLFDDIGLIRLLEPADFTSDNIKPICLPISRELQRQDLAEKNGVVAGWGVTEMGLQSPILLSVALPILRNNDCVSIFKKSVCIIEKQMCAGGIKNKDSCGGDSGGPLMFPGIVRSSGVRYVQRGVVSYGSKVCGIGRFPGVYTRVAYYMDWILDNIRA